MNTKFKTLIVAAAFAALGGAAHAVTFTGTAEGSWGNIQGGGAIGVSNLDGSGGSSDVTWGNPVGTTFSNRWRFDGVGADGGAGWSTDNDDLFALGSFSYRNGSVNGHTFTGADLSVELTFTNPFNDVETFAFGFDVINTPNTGGGNCCADTASITSGLSSTTFMYLGEEYTLELFGFSQDGGTTVTSTFDSPEGSNARATLYGRIIQPATIPLPAAGWMLLAGLGGLAAMRRKKS
ncbi:choice-of-anchor K domain-containing protein [Roseovarius sp. EL26]|uniref:choice-of-anchor K domain-containing protein n=1 Tax=Roseovarius sp. EL26 TaxID=2126672 RepID=UPI000EA2906E|nr:choice-of-anchor K domain-containing protein [Roseovarius sp. EL26]